jgi:hypothetical protein
LVEHQELDEAATNSDELMALSAVRRHLINSWNRTLGTNPSKDDIRDLLSIVHEQVLDVDEGGLTRSTSRAFFAKRSYRFQIWLK